MPTIERAHDKSGRTRADVDHLTHMVHCHVCPGRYTAEQMGLPGTADMHPRYASRMIGSPQFGGLWHCPKHARPELTDALHAHNKLFECGCPDGDWTEEPATAEQIERAGY